MRLIFAVCVIVLLAGCATAPQYEYVVDSEYVARVNLGAKIGGGQVIWVNYPTVHKSLAPAS